MKIMGRLEGGDLLAVVTRAERAHMNAIRILAEDIISAITSATEGLREDEAPAPEKTQAEKYAKAAGVPVANIVNVAKAKRVKAKTTRPEPRTNKGKHERVDSIISGIRKVMADGKDHPARDVTTAMGMDASDAKQLDQVSKMLSAYKKEFARVDRGVYRLIPGGEPKTPAVPAKATPQKARRDPALLPFDADLLNAEPKMLDDAQLKARLVMRKERGEEDKAARLEYLVRKQVG